MRTGRIHRSARNSHSARPWEQRDVQPVPMPTKTFRHPALGPITVDCDSLSLTDRDRHVVLCTAPQSSRDAEALALLGVLGNETMTDHSG